MSELTAHASGSPDDAVRAERAFRRKLTNYVRRVQRLSPSRHEKEALRRYVAQYADIDPATLAPPAELPPQQKLTPQPPQLQQLQEAEGEGVPRGDSPAPLGYADPLDAWRPLLSWFDSPAPLGYADPLDAWRP